MVVELLDGQGLAVGVVDHEEEGWNLEGNGEAEVDFDHDLFRGKDNFQVLSVMLLDERMLNNLHILLATLY